MVAPHDTDLADPGERLVHVALVLPVPSAVVSVHMDVGIAQEAVSGVGHPRKVKVAAVSTCGR